MMRGFAARIGNVVRPRSGSARQEFAPVWEAIAFEFLPNAGLHFLAFGVEAGLRALVMLQKFAVAKLSVLDHAPQFARLKSVAEAMQLHKRVEFQEGDWLRGAADGERTTWSLWIPSPRRGVSKRISASCTMRTRH